MTHDILAGLQNSACIYGLASSAAVLVSKTGDKGAGIKTADCNGWGNTCMKWVTAAEIDNWTDREPRTAQEMIPLLIWKLILASCKQIKDHHFPYGKAIQYSGYDGMLETEDISPFFPSGKSVWEIGTDKDSLGKFKGDYKKRTDNPNGIVMRETTFCFVTSRIWNHKQGITEMTREKNADGKWKEVRIIDANSLELWLNACPAVTAWFSNVIGKPMKNMQELGEYWQGAVESTTPRLTVEYFTYQRDPIAAKILNQIHAGARQIVLVGSSSLEVRLTLAAELAVADDLTHQEFAARCIVVRSQEAFDEANTQYTNVVIIPTFLPSFAQIGKQNNIVLLPVCKSDPLDLISRTGSRIEIPPRSRHEFCEALEKLGYDTNTAYQLGADLRCSFPALFRRITTDTMQKLPTWIQNKDVGKLVPILFAGAWEENCVGDTRAISALTGMPYEDYMATIQEYVSGENAPIFAVNHSYAFIAISDMWDVLWGKITPDVFNRFKECFLLVFAENDSTYDLPEDKWPFANVLGKGAEYSRQLKEGLIVSIIMLTEREEPGRGSGFCTHIIEECAALVRQIFGASDTLNHWRTMCQHLPTLMEAAPDVVLQVLEEAAGQLDSPLWELFKPASDMLFGRSFYTHILWALEKMMWDKHHASRALQLLVFFAEKKFEYKLGNSPEDTLYRIFCLWDPQGVFTQSERKILLNDIAQTHHAIAPRLFGSLLAYGHQTSSPILKPKWRDAENQPEPITQGEYADMCCFTAQIYLESITPCFEDWVVVFSNLPSFGDIELIIEKCRAQAADMSDEDKLKLCREMSQYISRSRQFDSDDLAERVNAVEELYFSILPDSPQSYAHYFSFHFNGLNPRPYKKEDHDFAAERQQLKDFQKEKIREMVSRFGPESIWEIIPQIEDTHAYADIIAEDNMAGQFDWGRIKRLREISPSAASSVISSLYYKSGLSIFETGVEQPEPTDLGWILSCMTINPEIADYVEHIQYAECRRVYWERVRIFGIDMSDKEWVKKCIHILLEYNRPYTIIDWLAFSDLNDTDLILEVLYAALRQNLKPEPDGFTLEQVGSYNIEQMFQKLYANTDVPELDVARLEIAYLGAFRFDFEPKYLVDQVLSCPELYMELLTTAYRSDNGAGELHSNPLAVERAYEALNRIHRIPGFNMGDKNLDEDAFAKWVEDVTKLAGSRSYTHANDIVMGGILSYAPVGEDGIWPARCVRCLFEKPHSETLENQFIIGKENQRGVHYATGGVEEDALAEKYDAYAEQLQLSYPHMAAIIRRISDDYRTQAKTERARELKGDY